MGGFGALRQFGNWFLDGTIALSFDASGYRRHSRSFEDPEIDVNLEGRTCLVTGANSGLGRATAVALARRGAAVRLLCRNPERGRRTEEEIRVETGNQHVVFDRIDLSSLESVREFAEGWQQGPIHALVHNAGVLPAERHLTEDDLELCLATNLVGPFLLTALLWPQLAAASVPRIVFVSSGGMYAKRLDIEAIRGRDGKYDGVSAYAHTKRGQVVLSEMLASRLVSRGIAVHAMHPGWADTPGVRNSIPKFWKTTRGILRTAEQGADTTVWLAATERSIEESGRFWFDRRPRSTHLLPGTRETETDRAALWEALTRWARLDGEEEVWPTL